MKTEDMTVQPLVEVPDEGTQLAEIQENECKQVEGAVYALAASPAFAQDGACFAATSAGLYRTQDGGCTWQYVFESLNLNEPMATSAVAISPDYASDCTVFAGAMGGIVRSTDGGETWQVSMLPTPPPLPLSIAVSPDYARDGVLLAGTMEDGTFRSADRGRRWARWNFGLLDLNVLTLAISPAFADDETLFAGVETGIFRSTNGARAWREVDFPTDLAPVLSLALSPRFADDRVIFAGTEACGLLRSDDDGRTWERLGEDRISDSVNGIILSPDFPASPHVLAVLGDTLVISRDGGASWDDWKAGLVIEEGLAAVVAPLGLAAGAPLLAGCMAEAGGVLRL